MIYFILFILLYVNSIFDYLKNDQKRTHFYLGAFLLISFCAFRFGVGFDYFNYAQIYELLPEFSFNEKQNIDYVHGEYLFLRYFMILKKLGLEYEYASAITIILINLLIFRFINRYSEFKSLSLVVLYCWFFVYIFSTLRQGLALAIILGIGFTFLEKGKTYKFLLICLLSSLFHSSALICVVYPIIIRYRPQFIKLFPYLFFILLFFAFIPNPILNRLSDLIERNVYLEAGMNPLALINRLLSFLLVFFFFKSRNLLDEKIISIYYLGVLLYLFLAQSDLIASRMVVYFKIFELYLYPKIILQLNKKYSVIFLTILFCYLGFMLMNMIFSMAINQNIPNGWDYPYITIFEANGLI